MRNRVAVCCLRLYHSENGSSNLRHGTSIEDEHTYVDRQTFLLGEERNRLAGTLALPPWTKPMRSNREGEAVS